MLFNETWGPAVMRASYIAPAIMNVTNVTTTGMLGTVALDDQRECLLKIHLVCVHVCSTFS